MESFANFRKVDGHQTRGLPSFICGNYSRRSLIYFVGNAGDVLMSVRQQKGVFVRRRCSSALVVLLDLHHLIWALVHAHSR